MHTFDVSVRWQGSTSSRDYAKEATASVDGKVSVPVSTSANFGGAPSHWNADELFGAAMSNCHMQTFLSLAAKVGVDVLAYDDACVVVLEEIDRISRITRVFLRPTVTITNESDVGKAAKFFEKAHKYCFIANSSTAEVVMEPTFVRPDGTPAS